MFTTPLMRVAVAVFVTAWTCAPAQLQAQIQPSPEYREVQRFDSARLEQLVAGIALYPDSLLSHALMAATYPVEVVEAERFVAANPSLSGDALQTAIVDKNWDGSVRALVGFPDVLQMMSANLDWTRDLGDAFLGQKSELMDAVQRLRQRARDAGTLASTTQQTVTVQEPNIIVIESASPEVIYVPRYSPTVVYGGWSYPYSYYPGFISYTHRWGGLSFSLGYTWRDWLWARPSWCWGCSDIFVDYSRWHRFHRRWGGHDHHDWHDGHFARGEDFRWNHRAEHRRGARYRDPVVARQYERRSQKRFEGQLDATPNAIRQPELSAPQRGDRRVDRAPNVSKQPERSVPQRVDPRRVEKSPNVKQPDRTSPQQVERRVDSTPKVTRQVEPRRVERQAPQRVERSSPQRVDRQAPQRVERPSPQRVERATPQRVERSKARPAPSPSPKLEQRSSGRRESGAAKRSDSSRERQSSQEGRGKSGKQ